MSHPIRRQILFLLEREGFQKHSDLMERLKLDTTGKLNFHLNKLEHLIVKDGKTGAYFLSEEGKRIIEIMLINDRMMKGENIAVKTDSLGKVDRIGVIICNCNGEVSDCLDTAALEQYVRKINDVISVKIIETLCQVKYLKDVHRWCKEHYLNKIVIAACSPKAHQTIFEAMVDGIIEKPNIEIANIREQCVWVHQPEEYHDVALKKAQILIESAVARLAMQKQITLKKVQVEKSCAIIGGGIAGMTLALNLARAGIDVSIIEKSPTLGGMAARWSKIQGMADCSICFISELVGEIKKYDNIHIHTNTVVERVDGEVGNFSLELVKHPRFVDEEKCTGCGRCAKICKLKKENQYEFDLVERPVIYIPYSHAFPYAAVIDEEDIDRCRNCKICERACTNNAIDLNQTSERFRIKAGVKIIAVGAGLNVKDLHMGHDPLNGIITSPEFERMLSSDGPTQGRMVIYPDGKPPKSIAYVKLVGNGANNRHDKPEIELHDQLEAKYQATIMEQLPRAKFKVFDASMVTIEIDTEKRIVEKSGKRHVFDMIILGVENIPNPDLKELRKIFDFTLDDFGYMSPETLSSGVFGIGSVLGPSSYKDVLFSVNKAAMDIIALLSKEYLITDYTGIEHDPEKCGLCGSCVRSCPYNAIMIQNEKIIIDKFKCKGCGTCVSVCPTGAIDMNVDSTGKILRSIDVLSKYRVSPKIIAFCCRSCGYAAADDAGLKKIFYRPNVVIVRVPCSGRVDTSFITHAFERGFDGVIIVGCKKDACRFIDGFFKAKKKINLLQQVFGDQFASKIILESMSAVEGNKFAQTVNSFHAKLTGGDNE